MLFLTHDNLHPSPPWRYNDTNWHQHQLQSGANDARSDDTAKLKVAVAHWVNASTQESSTNETSNWLDPTSRQGRGIDNDVTGRLLCPIDYDWDDPSYVTCSNFFLTMA